MIKRTRLLDDIADPTKRRWLIEAGAGLGKTVLLEHMRASLVESLIIVRRPLNDNGLRGFAAELAGAARRLGHTQTAEALAVTDIDPALTARILGENNQALAIDDVHEWDSNVGEFIFELVRYADPDADVLLAGRFLPAPLESLRRGALWHHLGASDLAFTAAETYQSLEALGIDDRDLAGELHRVTSGWPLAISIAVAQLQDAADGVVHAGQLGREPALLGELLETQIGSLDQRDVEALRALALMPFFDEVVADMFGRPGVVARLAAAGIAITRRVDGWAELAEPLRSRLRHQANSSPRSAALADLPADAISHLVAKDEIHAAINTCLAFGNRTLAAATIAGLTRQQERDLDIASLELAIEVIGDAAAAAPRALLVLARRYFETGDGAEALDFFRMGAELFDELDPQLKDPAHLEMLLQYGTFLIVSGDADGAQPIAERVTPHVEAADVPLLRADLHELRGLIAHASASEVGLITATGELTNALAIRRSIGEPTAAAATLSRLAIGVLWQRGRPAEALTMLDEIHALGPMTMSRQARLAVARAFVLPSVGRAHEVAELVANARHTAELLGLQALVLQAEVADTVAASVMGHCERTSELATGFLATDDLIYNAGQHAVHTLMVAEAAARCKDFAIARQLLDAAREVTGIIQRDIAWADATIEASDGDPATALRTFEQLARQSEITPEHSWRFLLFRAHCHAQLGSLVEANGLFQDAFTYCRNNGEPALPAIVENTLVSDIQAALQRSTRSTAAPAAPAAAPQPVQPVSSGPSVSSGIGTEDQAAIIEVALFDDFRLVVNGQAVDVPRGQPAELIALLVLNDGQLVIDQVVDALWPDANLTIGRKRLRNVLNRLRTACGEIVERSDGAIVLATPVASDYERAVNAGRQALAPPQSLPLLKRAITLYGRELLPASVGKDWADEARAEQRQRLTRLLDVYALQSEAAGATDTAVAALRRAATLESHDVSRLAHAAQLLENDGRSAAAKSISPAETRS